MMKEAQRIQYKPTYILDSAPHMPETLELAGDSADYSSFYILGIHIGEKDNTKGYTLFKECMKKYNMCSVATRPIAMGFRQP